MTATQTATNTAIKTKTNPLAGKNILWTFSDGQMANVSFQHSFREDTVVYQMKDGKDGKVSMPHHYEVAAVGQDVVAVSYQVPEGLTLTTILDFTAMTLVAFSSNEKVLAMQYGTFKLTSDTPETQAQPH